MKILIVNKFARVTGGADAHCIGLAELLRSKGHDVRFLTTSDKANVERDAFVVAPTVTHASRGAVTSREAFAIAANAFWNAAAAAQMRLALRAFGPDVVHSHKIYPQLSVAPLVIAADAGVPVVQTIHDHEFVAANPIDDECRYVDLLESRWRYRALNTAHQLVRRTIHRHYVRRWVAVSEYIAAIVTRHGLATTVVPNFVRAPGGDALEWCSRSGVVFVGRLTREKGIEDVIAVARAHPKLAVTIAGTGEMRERVERATRELPNLMHVGLVEHEDVARLLARARVCIMPSRRKEAGPVTALEAMAVGTPIVAYPAGGLGEYVRRAGAGLVVDSLSELITGVTSMVEDEARWSTVSACARYAARVEHGPEIYVRRIVDVYEGALTKAATQAPLGDELTCRP